MHVHKFFLFRFFFPMYLCLLYQVYEINIYIYYYLAALDFQQQIHMLK